MTIQRVYYISISCSILAGRGCVANESSYTSVLAVICIFDLASNTQLMLSSWWPVINVSVRGPAWPAHINVVDVEVGSKW